jgi:hypothetical protein
MDYLEVLPAEMVSLICSYLGYHDIKSVDLEMNYQQVFSFRYSSYCSLKSKKDYLLAIADMDTLAIKEAFKDVAEYYETRGYDISEYVRSDVIINNPTLEYHSRNNFYLLDAIPTGIASLTYLKVLHLVHCRIKIIPSEIGYLINLEKISLYDNRIQEIPIGLLRLTQLKVLRLSHNKIKSIPKEINGLVNLIELNLTSNQITSIPKEIGGLSKLRMLYLGCNPIKSIPVEICVIPGLLELTLNSTRVKKLPVEIRGSSVRYLNIQHSRIKELPDDKHGTCTHR